MCVLTDTHGHTRTSTYVLCVLADSHGRPVCAGGYPQTSCVCWRTPTDVLCVLNRQPTWDKITRTVHGKGQRAESKDQRADMRTDGQPRTSCVPRGKKSPKQSTGRARVLSPRTNVLICVLMDSHGRPVCADGHTRTHMDSHGHPVCADGHTRTQPTWAKITQTVHGKGQRAVSKDQRADMCTDGKPRTSYSPRGPKSPKQSTGTVSMLSPRTNVLICVLIDSHRRPVCADGHTQTATDVLTNVLICVLMDSHRRPVCADGHTRTSCVCGRTPTDVLCVLNRQPTWAKITRTVHGKGQRAESKDQPTDVLCVLTDTHGQPRTSHGRPVCADRHTQTHTDSHRHHVCADGQPQTATDVLCVLAADTYGSLVCNEQTAHVGQNYPNSPREGPACGVQEPTQPTWAKITRTVHGKGQRADMCTDGRPLCADGHTWTSCVC
ncbi:unnamed protein product [Brassica rapa]|uniref:Uncharacterized protein n=1 Tax=Brassica campestris TaxID=3711 RepID=A0A8D9D5I2_BRACM|nr:unnamed protein product [Brassica rapa]